MTLTAFFIPPPCGEGGMLRAQRTTVGWGYGVTQRASRRNTPCHPTRPAAPSTLPIKGGGKRKCAPEGENNQPKCRLGRPSLRHDKNITRALDLRPVAVEIAHQPLHLVAAGRRIERSAVAEFVERLMHRRIDRAPCPPC